MHDSDTKRILFIDDDLTWGELISRLIVDRCRQQLDWFVRARLTADGVILMDADGRERVLNPDNYSFALVDGRLKGSPLDGWELAPHLVAAGLKVVAVSGCSSLNDQMRQSGASDAIVKDELMRRAFAGNIGVT